MKISTIVLCFACLLLVSTATANKNADTANHTHPPTDYLLPDKEPSRYQGAGYCNTSTTRACVERLEFCGTDNQCHLYSCENWYRFGPPEYTGHVLGIPVARPVPITRTGNNTMYLVTEEQPDQGADDFDLPELVCEDNIPPNAVLEEENTYAPAIIYGCQRWVCVGDECKTFGEERDPKEGVAMDYLRRCTATNVGQRYKFYCRDNLNTPIMGPNIENKLPEDDYRLRSFLQAVDRGYVNCSNEYMDQPKFLYSLYFQSSLYYGSVNYGSNTQEFNTTHASSAMKSNLEYMHSDDSSHAASHFLQTSIVSFLCSWIAMTLFVVGF